jgi:hypothetical protein
LCTTLCVKTQTGRIPEMIDSCYPDATNLRGRFEVNSESEVQPHSRIAASEVQTYFRGILRLHGAINANSSRRSGYLLLSDANLFRGIAECHP